MNIHFLFSGKKYDYRVNDISKGLYVLNEEKKTYIKVDVVTKELQELIDSELLKLNNKARKEEIFKELDRLDLKLIRPMSENDDVRVGVIKGEKEALRTELQGL